MAQGRMSVTVAHCSRKQWTRFNSENGHEPVSAVPGIHGGKLPSFNGQDASFSR